MGGYAHLSFRIDHSEPIPALVARLENEHKELSSELDHVIRVAGSGDLKVAESILLSLSQQFLRHAVEEEARIIRVIAEKAHTELERNSEVMRHQSRRISKGKTPSSVRASA